MIANNPTEMWGCWFQEKGEITLSPGEIKDHPLSRMFNLDAVQLELLEQSYHSRFVFRRCY